MARESNRDHRWRQGAGVALACGVGDVLQAAPHGRPYAGAGWCMGTQRAVLMLLVCLMVLSACSVLGSDPATPPTASAPAAASTPLEDWHTYTFTTYGFRVDVPAVLQPHHATLINGGSGEAIAWFYEHAPVGSPLRQASADARVLIQYSTAITDTNICPLHGTPITLDGIAARRE